MQRVEIERLLEGISCNANGGRVTFGGVGADGGKGDLCSAGLPGRLGKIHAVQLDGELTTFVKLHDLLTGKASVGQLGQQLVVVLCVVQMLCGLNFQNGIGALSGQRDLLLLPALTGAVQQHLRGVAGLYRLVVPRRAQANHILPCSGGAQLGAGKGQEPGDIGLIVIDIDGLAFIVVQAAAGRIEDAVPLCRKSSDILAGAGNIAQNNGAVGISHAAVAAAHHITGGLQNIHIGPVLAGVCVIAAGYLAHQPTDVVTGGLDGAVGVAVLHNTAALVGHQPADGTHRYGIGDLDGEIAGVAGLDAGGSGITDQPAGIKLLAVFDIGQGAVRHGTARYGGLVDITDQHAHLAAACDPAVLHADIGEVGALHRGAHQPLRFPAAQLGAGNLEVFHQQVFDDAALLSGNGVEQVGAGQVLQLDVADDMLIAIQLAGEHCILLVIGDAAVDDDLCKGQPGFGKIDICGKPVVPAHFCIDIRPILCGSHRFPEFDAGGGVAFPGFPAAAARGVYHAGDIIAADILRLIGIGVNGDLQNDIIQAIRSGALVYHAGLQPLDGNGADGIVFVIAQAQPDVPVIHAVGIGGVVLLARPLIAYQLGGVGVIQYRQGDILLILLHDGGQIDPGVEPHGKAVLHRKAIPEDGLLPVDIIELIQPAMQAGPQILIIAAGKRPNILINALGAGGQEVLHGGGGQQIGATFAPAHLVVVAYGIAVPHTGHVAAVKGAKGGGGALLLGLYPGIQQNIHVLQVLLVVADAEQLAGAGAARYKARAVFAVDIAVFADAHHAVGQGAVGNRIAVGDQVAAQLHDEVPQGGAGVIKVTDEAGISAAGAAGGGVAHLHLPVGAQDKVFDQAITSADEVPVGIDIDGNMGEIVDQIIGLGARIQVEKHRGDIFALGDDMPLEIDGTVEGGIGMLVLHKVIDDQNMAVGVPLHGRYHFLVVGNGDVVAIGAEGDGIQHDLTALIGGGKGGLPALIKGQPPQNFGVIHRKGAVLIPGELDILGKVLIGIFGQLHAVGAQDGKMHLAAFSRPPQVAPAVIHGGAQLGGVFAVNCGGIVFPYRQLAMDGIFGEVSAQNTHRNEQVCIVFSGRNGCRFFVQWTGNF